MAKNPLSGDSTPWRLPFIVSLLFVIVVVVTDAFNAPAVDRLLWEVHACRAGTNPALAVAVVQDGRVLLSRGYGVTRPGGRERVTGSTRFNIASLSKAFAATLLLKVMEEDGRYNLSTKLRDILGEDFQLGDEFRTQEATVEDALSHKTGIPANNRMRFNNNLTRANVQDRLKFLKTPDAFRTVYIYSNLLYGLATRMTEVIGGASWEELVRRHLYQPLRMSRSSFVKEALSGDSSGFAPPYNVYFGRLKPVSHLLPLQWSELAGSGSVVTTADDMAKWMNFHLSKGQGPGGRRVMEEDTMEELYKPRTAMDKPTLSSFRQPEVPVTFAQDVYGMGFRRGYYRGFPVVGHGGSSYGYRSLLTLVPSHKLGVFAVMSGGDSDYRTRGTLTSYLLDQALGLRPWLNVSTMCSFPAPWHNVSDKAWPPYDTSTPLAYNLSAYVGLYENPAYGTFEVREWEGSEENDEGEDDGREPAAPLTLLYGFATWDLIPLSSSSSSDATTTTPSSSSSSSSSPAEQQSFYGKGRNVTAWVDYSPFVFHAPPEGSDVVVEMSAPGLEKRAPPVFTRVGMTSSGDKGCGLSYYGLLFLLSAWLLIDV